MALAAADVVVVVQARQRRELRERKAPAADLRGQT